MKSLLLNARKKYLQFVLSVGTNIFFFTVEIPPAKQLEVVHKLIAVGVEMGIIRPDYKLIGHRQAGSTECPGEALFNEISKWDHFQREV